MTEFCSMFDFSRAKLIIKTNITEKYFNESVKLLHY